MDIRILIVEDDYRINRTVTNFLQNAGYTVDACADGDTALERFYDNKYHLAVLDIMLPGTDGLELLREIRRLSDLPVLIMTALDDDDSQLRAFSNLADDYVTKPFSMQILLKRVEALLRRSGVLQQEIRAGKLTLYPEQYRTGYDGMEVTLTPREFDILLLLCRNSGKVLPHERILTLIWGYDFSVGEGILHSHIRNLRAKLPVNIISTIKGVGYRLEVEPV